MAVTAAKIREVSMAVGFHKQSAITVPNIIATDIWRLHKTNAALLNPEFVVESDAADLGKDTEFETANFASHVNIVGSIEKYNSAEFLAWCAAFGLGAVTPSLAYLYTCTPIVAVTSGLELPYFTYYESMRYAADPVFNRGFPGCVVNDFLVDIQTSPGRSSSKITANFIGCGDIITPASAHPSALVEQALPGSSAAITMQGATYTTDKKLVSAQWGWNNNVNADSGFYPGCGFCTDAPTFAKRGRLEFGNRVPILRFVVRLMNGSPEYGLLMGGTASAGTITQTFDVGATYTATFPLVSYSAVTMGDTDGIVTVAVECTPRWSGTAILTVAALCDEALICSAPTA